MGDANPAEDRRLVLLVDHDVEARRHARHLLEMHGMEVVQASNGMAALELIQRLPNAFRLVIAEVDLPGISGAVMAETLRLFRPDLPTLCMSSRVVAGSGTRRCLSKPLQGPDLLAAIHDARSWEEGQLDIGEEHLARVRARFAVARDLVEAAMELARGSGGAA